MTANEKEASRQGQVPVSMTARLLITACLLLGACGEAAAGPAEPTAFPSGDRLAGASRWETAVAISREQFPDGADVVYLADGHSLADAVAGGSLTAGPTLLVPRCGELPTVVAEEVRRLRPERVLTLGGERAICDATLASAVRAARRAVTGVQVSARLVGSGAQTEGLEVSVTQPVETADDSVRLFLQHDLIIETDRERTHGGLNSYAESATVASGNVLGLSVTCGYGWGPDGTPSGDPCPGVGLSPGLVPGRNRFPVYLYDKVGQAELGPGRYVFSIPLGDGNPQLELVYQVERRG